MEIIIGCLLVITAVAVYVPIAYLRLSNKMLKAMEQIEANTRK
jgi:hypothetical protein